LPGGMKSGNAIQCEWTSQPISMDAIFIPDATRRWDCLSWEKSCCASIPAKTARTPLASFRLGRRRRVQRSPRVAPLLRTSHSHCHGACRQPGRPPRRGLHPPGRRRYFPAPMGLFDGVGRTVRNGLNFTSAASACVPHPAVPTEATQQSAR